MWEFKGICRKWNLLNDNYCTDFSEKTENGIISHCIIEVIKKQENKLLTMTGWDYYDDTKNNNNHKEIGN